MALHAGKTDGVPEETAQVARAAFPKGSLAVWIRAELGELFSDTAFAGSYPDRGKPPGPATPRTAGSGCRRRGKTMLVRLFEGGPDKSE